MAKPPSIHQKLFRLFTPTKVSGHGIGLYHVRSILQTYGGSIMVRSAENGGTTLKVTWPETPRHLVLVT